MPLVLQPDVVPSKNKPTNVKKKETGAGKRRKGSPTDGTVNQQTASQQQTGKQSCFCLPDKFLTDDVARQRFVECF